MIRLNAEATIDIDKNRRVWLSASAECDPDEVDLDEVSAGLAAAVTTQCLAAYQQVVPRYESVSGLSADEIAKQRGEGKEVAPTETFGD